MKQALSLFLQFFILGCTSFGGPAAHLGYFRKTFVEDKKWLTDEHYAQLVALSQFLPGPGSSQVGFAIGLHRLGLLGGILAFIAFTLPSFLLMLAFATGLSSITGTDISQNLIHSFKLLAVIVVLDATISMGKNFCSEKRTQVIAVLTACFILLSPVPFSQIMCIAIAAIVGGFMFKSSPQEDSKSAPLQLTPWQKFAQPLLFLTVFILCLLGLTPLGQIFNDSFIAGSLVFGGGHVVLPLLQEYFVDSVGQQNFISGYAAAQAIPGPMFTFATFLGALSHESALIGATLATAGIFLPGFLLVLMFHKHWQALASKPSISAIVKGINAAVIGLLAATLYDPIFTSSVAGNIDLVLIIIGFTLLRVFNLSVLKLIFLFIIQALLITFI